MEFKVKPISKTRLARQANKKQNPELRTSILLLKKQKNVFWHKVAKLLSRPKRKSISVNLDKINKVAKENSTILVAGKILARGDLNKKLAISAFKTSGEAKNKIKSSGSSYLTISELIKKDPEAKNIKLII